MKYQISQNAFNQLRTLYLSSQPRIGYAELTGSIIQGFILNKLVWTRNFFERLQKTGGTTKEIQSRDRRNMGRNYTRSTKKEVSRLMCQRIGTIGGEIRAQQHKCRSIAARIEEAFDPQSRRQFSEIKRTETSRVWEIERTLKMKKLQDLKPKLPEVLDGILLSDEKLREAYGNPTVEVVVLGGIQASENIKAFLRLPLKFRSYCKPDRDTAVVQNEGRAARQRWIIRDKNTNGVESFEAYSRRKERQEDQKEPNRGNGHIDFSNLPVTQLMANKFIHLPAPASEEQEIRMGGEKIQLLDAWESYIEENSDAEGRIVGSNNLTRAEALGRKEIADGVKNRSWMLYGTDKSGKLVLDTKANFLKCMEPHYQNDQEVTYNAVLKSEPLLNNHAKAWAKVLNMGLNAGPGQYQRIREALTVKNSNVAILKGLRKDHKRAANATEGPPLRPLADGKVGPNAHLANLMARVLRPVREGIHDKIPTEIISTEEALFHLEQFNRNAQQHHREQHRRSCRTPNMQTDSIQVGSMDVCALYPNCKVAPTIKKIEELVTKSGLEFDNINLGFLTKFVSVLTRGIVSDQQLQRFIQIPKRRTTVNSYMRRQAEEQFDGPALEEPRNLSHEQVRSLIAIAAAKSTKVVMENHFYQIGGKIYRQREGSAIGVDLSVESASLYMTDWDDSFLKKLKKLGIRHDVYLRYVDDIVIVLKGIHHCWYFCARRGRMVFDNTRQVTCSEDQYTFQQLRDIANTLDENIQMTLDVPSLHEDGRLPVLDLGLYVVNKQIKTSFYSKPMSSPYQIHFRSAIPSRTKRDTLLQEGIRRFRNSGPNVSNLEIQNVFSKYMNSLIVSG